MRRPKHEIEANIPPRQDQLAVEASPLTSLPQIRRQVERICESLGVEYDDLSSLILEPGLATAITYDRNEAGEFYLNEFNKPAMSQHRIPVDTVTFLGDERDF